MDVEEKWRRDYSSRVPENVAIAYQQLTERLEGQSLSRKILIVTRAQAEVALEKLLSKSVAHHPGAVLAAIDNIDLLYLLITVPESLHIRENHLLLALTFASEQENQVLMKDLMLLVTEDMRQDTIFLNMLQKFSLK